MALLLACVKQLRALTAFIANDWKDDQRIWVEHGGRVEAMTIGIYGFGPIGRHFARILEPYGCPVLIYDPYATDIPQHAEQVDSLEALFDRSDAVSIHCGLNDATRASVNGNLLDRLPQGGVLVNTARGPIVVEADLAERVKAGRLLAGLDVIEKENAWPESLLMGLTGALLTGHKVSASKGPNPDKPKEPQGLPPFVVNNVLALASGQDEAIVNEILPEVFAIKT